MISVASTLLLVSLVFGSVPSAWAAPIGTRDTDVRAMRRMERAENFNPARREHHSATSAVPRADDPAPIVARADDPVTVVARAGAVDPADAAKEPIAKVAIRNMRRHHAKNEQDKDVKPRALPRFKRDAIPRREDATSSNVAREGEKVKRSGHTQGPSPVDGGVRARDVPKHQDNSEHTPPVTAIKRSPAATPTPVADAVVPRNHDGCEHGGDGGGLKACNKKPAPSAQNNTQEKKREEMKETVAKREEKKPGLTRPIAIFRRALAFEDLD
ncbi:hypothetical protein D9615_006151 [Tricholomella constricta]|uniref:Uncharacterized protein n=1 Tax=Tricholomella constricta TaxID=117010 RepID=A0A8H5M461_9AGAR|nr:hypothetical protein D9615_006151 [Tricholomella constricta]